MRYHQPLHLQALFVYFSLQHPHHHSKTNKAPFWSTAPIPTSSAQHGSHSVSSTFDAKYRRELFCLHIPLVRCPCPDFHFDRVDSVGQSTDSQKTRRREQVLQSWEAIPRLWQFVHVVRIHESGLERPGPILDATKFQACWRDFQSPWLSIRYDQHHQPPERKSHARRGITFSQQIRPSTPQDWKLAGFILGSVLGERDASFRRQ